MWLFQGYNTSFASYETRLSDAETIILKSKTYVTVMVDYCQEQ